MKVSDRCKVSRWFTAREDNYSPHASRHLKGKLCYRSYTVLRIDSHDFDSIDNTDASNLDLLKERMSHMQCIFKEYNSIT